MQRAATAGREVDRRAVRPAAPRPRRRAKPTSRLRAPRRRPAPGVHHLRSVSLDALRVAVLLLTAIAAIVALLPALLERAAGPFR